MRVIFCCRSIIRHLLRIHAKSIQLIFLLHHTYVSIYIRIINRIVLYKSMLMIHAFTVLFSKAQVIGLGSKNFSSLNYFSKNWKMPNGVAGKATHPWPYANVANENACPSTVDPATGVKVCGTILLCGCILQFSYD